MGRAAEAKQKALEKLKARPAPDEAALAARRETRLARQIAQAEARAARQAERAGTALVHAPHAEQFRGECFWHGGLRLAV